MPSYTIDASNNTEPLDTRYVADFPAELRAMKSRMNQAINDQGQLSGGLKTDGTNFMTGALGVGEAATGGNKLQVLGSAKITGDLAVTGKSSATVTAFVPSNASVINAAHVSVGPYGGGMLMIDGAHYSGMYATAGTLCLGSGSSAGMVEKVAIGTNDCTFTGAGTSQVKSKALSGYASFYAQSSGTNAAYIFFGNATGERGRISADDQTNMVFGVGAGVTAAVLTSTKNFNIWGDEFNVGGAQNANQKRFAFQSSARYAYFCLNSDGSMNFYDQTAGYNRLVTDIAGNLTVHRSVAAEGPDINIGAGTAGAKSLILSNNIRAVHLEHSADGATTRLVDYGAGVVRWTTDVAGNFTAAGNITAYSDKRLKHDVQVIHGALDKVKALRGVTFKWNRDNSGGIGFIAQELEQVCPELVHNCADIKSVAYGNVTALLVEAVKELSMQIAVLKGELAALRGD